MRYYLQSLLFIQHFAAVGVAFKLSQTEYF